MINNGPWKIKSSEVKYQSPWIKVREDSVIRPDGKDGIWSIVEKLPGVSVLSLDEDGYVYLTDEFKYTMGKALVECVNGAIDDGEEPLAAAKRELKEELGISAAEWRDMGLVNAFTEGVLSPTSIFLARKLTFGPQELESGEVISMKKMKLSEAVDMVMKSEITHGAGSILILKTKIFLDTQGV